MLLNFPAAATSEFTKPVQQAYHEIIKLRVAFGKQILQPELQKDDNNACALLVANYADFLTVLVSQNEKVYKKLRSQQEKRLDLLAALKENTPYKRYAQAEIRLQLAMCEVFFSDEVQAAWHVRSAYLLLNENQKLYPDFIPNRKSLGLLQVIIGSVPDSYQWVFNILGMRGDIKGGLANLSSAARIPNLFQTEASIYLQFAQDWMNRKDNSGPKFLSKLAADNPDNLLFTYLAMSMLKKNKNCDAALAIFQKRPTDSRYLEFPYLHHMAADMFLYKGEYVRSLHENQYFLDHYQGKHYRKDANFKLYLASILSDDPMTAQLYYSRINNTGAAVVEEDKYAQKFVENKDIINKQLVKARLHADGGYFPQALTALENFKSTSRLTQKERTELFYRKARIFQGLGKEDSAIVYYQKTIETAGNMAYYFAPNAALQLGYLAADRNDKTAARKYFKKALSYPKHEYKNSIDSKAKIGLSTL
ncbi:tol-pal system YbgF family protein [Adhaeribacter terreus]|uniref:Tol-pal system YbgF family protein n=1 Tax=Adhaeribacter terreus TaxID=529703 RepID=A0ABW0E785_9BACT